ncbi:BMA-SPO-7, isoform b [Dirofilaria immitis]|nr:BMA-SPO-7, isoform b [Dirofilaria immitis]
MDETSAACEDLRYFERRLTEVIQSMQPAATSGVTSRIWMYVMERLLLAEGSSIRTVTLVESLQNHLVFSACVPSLLFLFGFVGIHNRAVAPSILPQRSVDHIGIKLDIWYRLWMKSENEKQLNEEDTRMQGSEYCRSLLTLDFLYMVIASRCRSVLADFSLSCDDSGKLIVRPPHRVHVSP